MIESSLNFNADFNASDFIYVREEYCSREKYLEYRHTMIFILIMVLIKVCKVVQRVTGIVNFVGASTTRNCYRIIFIRIEAE